MLRSAIGNTNLQQLPLIDQESKNISETKEMLSVETCDTNDSALVKNWDPKKNIDDIYGAQGRAAIHVAVARGNMEIIKYLLNQSADLSVRDTYGTTALQIASYLDNTQLAELLLASQASIDDKDNDGNTALHHSNSSMFSSIKMFKLLLENGIDVDAKNNKGLTALGLYIERTGNRELYNFYKKVQDPAPSEQDFEKSLNEYGAKLFTDIFLQRGVDSAGYRIMKTILNNKSEFEFLTDDDVLQLKDIKKSYKNYLDNKRIMARKKSAHNGVSLEQELTQFLQGKPSEEDVNNWLSDRPSKVKNALQRLKLSKTNPEFSISDEQKTLMEKVGKLVESKEIESKKIDGELAVLYWELKPLANDSDSQVKAEDLKTQHRKIAVEKMIRSADRSAKEEKLQLMAKRSKTKDTSVEKYEYLSNAANKNKLLFQLQESKITSKDLEISGDLENLDPGDNI